MHFNQCMFNQSAVNNEAVANIQTPPVNFMFATFGGGVWGDGHFWMGVPQVGMPGPAGRTP